MPAIRVTFFKQSDFNFTDLKLIVESYFSLNNYYIQARAIHLTESNTVSDKINKARLLAVNIETNRNISVNYTVT